MELIKIEPRDIHIQIDFTLEEIRQLHTALCYSQVTFNSDTEPCVAECVKQLQKFSNNLSETIKIVESETLP